MKKRNLKQNTFIQAVLVCFLLGSNSLKSQNESRIKNLDHKSTIENQGNGANYEEKKKDFISKNPNAYQMMSGEKIVENPKLKTQLEKDSRLKSLEKKSPKQNNEINSKETISIVPEFKSQEEKTNYFQKNNLKKEIISNNNDPTFPKMIVTGDPKKDAIAFEESKNIFYKKLEEKQNRKPTKEEINAKNQSLKERGIIVVTENN